MCCKYGVCAIPGWQKRQLHTLGLLWFSVEKEYKPLFVPYSFKLCLIVRCGGSLIYLIINLIFNV